MQGCCIFWDKGLAVAGGYHGEEGSTNSSPLISDHHVTDPHGKAGGRTFTRALRMTGAGEMGLAMSWNDPTLLRAGPFWSRLEKPPDWVGALPAAWENVFSELKGVIFLLPFHLFQAVSWGPREESSAAPGLAPGVLPRGGDILTKDSSNPDPAGWGRGRSGKASWRRWLLSTE